MFAKAFAALAVMLVGVPARAEVGSAPPRSLVGTGYWTVPSGVQTYWDPSELNSHGWTTWYDQPYPSVTTLANIQPPTGDCMLMAAKMATNPSNGLTPGPGATGTLILVAFGRTQVLYNNGGVFENGAYWYTFTNQSQVDVSKGYSNPGGAGFAATNEVTLDICDSTKHNDASDLNRLCWFIDKGIGGYRAGQFTSLGSQVYKLVMSGTCGDGTPCTNYPGGCQPGYTLQTGAKCLLSTCDSYDYGRCCKQVTPATPRSSPVLSPTSPTGPTNSNPSNINTALALARASLGNTIPFVRKFGAGEHDQEPPAVDGNPWHTTTAATVLGVVGLIGLAATVTVHRQRRNAASVLTLSPEATVEATSLLEG